MGEITVRQRQAMRKFKAALAHVVKVPKSTREQKQATPQPKKKRKG
jgi:hypothetical protein